MTDHTFVHDATYTAIFAATNSVIFTKRYCSNELVVTISNNYTAKQESNVIVN